MEQETLPDRIVLWVSHDDCSLLPAAVRSKTGGLFEVRVCEDLKSYKKIAPALLEFADCSIVVADDDVYYPCTWLTELVDVDSAALATVRCHMALRHHHDATGQIAPYHEWTYDVQDEISRSPGRDLVPLGVGGVLYPPGSLHRNATNKVEFMELCPDADDLWLYAMATMNGTRFVKVGRRFRRVEWPRTQDVALWRRNTPERSSEIVGRIVEKFGEKAFPRSRGD